MQYLDPEQERHHKALRKLEEEALLEQANQRRQRAMQQGGVGGGKRANLGGGASACCEAVNVTASQMYAAVVNGQLTPGTKYRITDYKSVNFLNGWQTANSNPTPTDPNFDPREIYVGEPEVLVVQALSEYEVSPIGYSETFPGDIVQYEPFVNKIGVDFFIQNGSTLPDASTVSGFDLQWDGTNVYFNMPVDYPVLFGHYFYIYCEFDGGNYYQDGAFDPILPGIATCQYPYSSDLAYIGYPKAVSRIKVENNGTKVILLDLTFTDYQNYDADTLYVNTVYAIGDAYGWITRRQDTIRNIDVPFDFRGRKYRRFEVDLSSLNPELGIGYYGLGDDYLGQGTTGNYYDIESFGVDGYDVFNIKWNDIGGPDGGAWYRGGNDNNVFSGNFEGTTISKNFRENTIGSGFNSNTIGRDFNYNTIDFSFFNNIIGTGFGLNLIGHNFRENTIGNVFFDNVIGHSFSENTIRHGAYENTIGNSFQQNTIGNEFRRNAISDSFRYNEINHPFYQNIIASGFNYNQVNTQIVVVNFGSASHVYQNYSCTLFNRSSNFAQLSYVNGSNVVQYAAVNA